MYMDTQKTKKYPIHIHCKYMCLKAPQKCLFPEMQSKHRFMTQCYIDQCAALTYVHLPGLSCHEFIILRGALVIILSVAQAICQTFANQSFCNIAVGKKEEKGPPNENLTMNACTA